VPFKSKAQRRKFQELLSEGKVTQKVFAEFQKDTPARLPERLKPKKKSVTKTRKRI